MTQHTTGVQGIRAFTILQLLLGNIGKPGGGVNALRGEPNVQGACDMAVLANYMPGYLNHPTTADATLFDYAKNNGLADSKYLVNTLKAFWGPAATKENDFAYDWLPKRSAAKDYGTLSIFEDALAGKMKVLWIVGQNPAVTLPNLNLTFEAMGEARDARRPGDLGDRDGRVLEAPRRRSRSRSRPRCFLLPAAFFMEKNGSISNSGRHGPVAARRREAAGAGQARRRDRRLRSSAACATSSTTRATRRTRSLKKAFWTYTTRRGRAARDQRPRPRRHPGEGAEDGRPRPEGRRPRRPTDRRRPAPGSTRASSATARTSRSAATRKTDPGGLGLYPGFGWTWPNNMRILYNRASCDAARQALSGHASRSSGGTRRRSAGRATTCPTSPS